MRAWRRERFRHARTVAAAAGQLEINVLGYALAVEGYVRRGDPSARQAAAKEAAEVEQHLSENERLANERTTATDGGRLRQSVAGLRTLGQTMLDAEERAPKCDRMQTVDARRARLQGLLEEELQTNANAIYDDKRDRVPGAVQAIFGFALLVLVAGVAVAVATSVFDQQQARRIQMARRAGKGRDSGPRKTANNCIDSSTIHKLQ